jgi:hypothetical protein
VDLSWRSLKNKTLNPVKMQQTNIKIRLMEKTMEGLLRHLKRRESTREVHRRNNSRLIRQCIVKMATKIKGRTRRMAICLREATVRTNSISQPHKKNKRH